MSRSSQSAVWPAHAPLGRRVRRARHDNATNHEGMQAAVVPVGARFAEGVGDAFAGRHVVRRREGPLQRFVRKWATWLVTGSVVLPVRFLAG